MNETRIIDMMRRIDSYIHGRLNQQEIDELWMEFLKELEWYKIFETDLHLRSLIRKKSKWRCFAGYCHQRSWDSDVICLG